MKRFYKNVAYVTAGDGYAVLLDDRKLKTPMGHEIIVGNAAWADALAHEWRTQGAEIVPATMPVMQMTCTLIDKMTDRHAIKTALMRYAMSDLLCYFATHPQDLVARQEKHWRPVLDHAAHTWGCRMETATGIRYVTQPDTATAAVSVLLDKLDDVSFTVVHLVTGATGSVLLALAFDAGVLDADAVFHAATVDEQYQLDVWGEDAPARKKLDALAAELQQIARFKSLTTGV